MHAVNAGGLRQMPRCESAGATGSVRGDACCVATHRAPACTTSGLRRAACLPWRYCCAQVWPMMRAAWRRASSPVLRATGRLRDLQLSVGELGRLALRYAVAGRVARDLRRELPRKSRRLERRLNELDRPALKREFRGLLDAGSMNAARGRLRAAEVGLRRRLRRHRRRGGPAGTARIAAAVEGGAIHERLAGAAGSRSAGPWRRAAAGKSPAIAGHGCRWPGAAGGHRWVGGQVGAPAGGSSQRCARICSGCSRGGSQCS